MTIIDVISIIIVTSFIAFIAGYCTGSREFDGVQIVVVHDDSLINPEDNL